MMWLFGNISVDISDSLFLRGFQIENKDIQTLLCLIACSCWFVAGCWLWRILLSLFIYDVYLWTSVDARILMWDLYTKNLCFCRKKIKRPENLIKRSRRDLIIWILFFKLRRNARCCLGKESPIKISKEKY
jgi:hypothetical protein